MKFAVDDVDQVLLVRLNARSSLIEGRHTYTEPSGVRRTDSSERGDFAKPPWRHRRLTLDE